MELNDEQQVLLAEFIRERRLAELD